VCIVCDDQMNSNMKRAVTPTPMNTSIANAQSSIGNSNSREQISTPTSRDLNNINSISSTNGYLIRTPYYAVRSASNLVRMVKVECSCLDQVGSCDVEIKVLSGLRASGFKLESVFANTTSKKSDYRLTTFILSRDEPIPLSSISGFTHSAPQCCCTGTTSSITEKATKCVTEFRIWVFFT